LKGGLNQFLQNDTMMKSHILSNREINDTQVLLKSLIWLIINWMLILSWIKSWPLLLS